MSDQKKFKHGAVEYPLDASTAESLLKDADPALHYAIQLFSSVLDTYVGPRLLAQAALQGFALPSAVEKTIHYEPTPYLLADQLSFPLLCLYRTEETPEQTTTQTAGSLSTWEWAYVLPPMAPGEIEALHPILRAVAVVMREFSSRSWDPGYEAGKTLRDLSGILSMSPGPIRYGAFEAVDNQEKFWRAISGKLFVRERDDIVTSTFHTFEGANIAIDETSADGVKLEDFIEIEANVAPTIEEVAPASGTKAGGTLVYVRGRNFRLGTTPRVLFGDAYADSVRVEHPTRLVCTTPEHEAQPTHAADVQVIDADGGESNVLEGAFTFTSP